MTDSHVPRDQLHRIFDGEATDQQTAAHVAACEECRGKLDDLRRQRDLLSALTAGTGTAALMDTVRRRSRVALADLVFELVRACLGEGDRDVAALHDDIERLHRRLGAPYNASSLPDHAPAVVERHAAARACLSLLLLIEGRSLRWHEWVVRIDEGKSTGR